MSEKPGEIFKFGITEKIFFKPLWARDPLSLKWVMELWGKLISG